FKKAVMLAVNHGLVTEHRTLTYSFLHEDAYFATVLYQDFSLTLNCHQPTRLTPPAPAPDQDPQ
ncbi:hypothetical protein, partial [Lacticaseibacillus zeae]